MRSRDIEVVGFYRNRRKHILDEMPSALPVLAGSQLDAYEQLGSCDRGDHHVILVADHRIERRGAALGSDKDGRVEN